MYAWILEVLIIRGWLSNSNNRKRKNESWKGSWGSKVWQSVAQWEDGWDGDQSGEFMRAVVCNLWWNYIFEETLQSWRWVFKDVIKILYQPLYEL